ncbi:MULTISPECIES: polysaccharide lyase family 7 protein [Aliiglaciecola]|uniref:polysaccharide lyase family 7 protein n=1 Tax=Aliiglaciecola TaxID=1406885 RepID=UPI001C07F7C7|nr:MULTISPECIES: polysaccharide lyase family 7 protein [Aliiglaciecola]MBU2879209.1 polysaccharide lyase family 7 protein [Aliiglaciecola lipolytica]MDO6712899.1 polysaccharide lyase family 7 protein [Aliiglaciecola sp. 2_MG-2023]MDO6752865.1 polysaccharide lyase family 7 protein [Aliiglaciecola sp. 1_MG-2023]
MFRKRLHSHNQSQKVHALIVMMLSIGISACGGSSGSTATPPVIPPVVVEPTPEVCVNEIYAITAASDDGSFESGYPPANAVDGLTTPESRWTSNGSNKELILDLGSSKVVGALTIKWYKGNERNAYFSVETSADTSLQNASWTSVLNDAESSGKHSGFELVNLVESDARYIKIIADGNSENTFNSIVEIQVHSCKEANGEFADIFPNEVGIDLLDWYLSVPTDEDNSGTSDSIFETELAAGYTNSEYFYASADNGIVMRSPSYGFKTSQNTSYVRVELREMLRRGNTSISTQGVNKNNWVFASASSQGQANAGGVDGDLRVSLAVNKVTTTGEDYQIGRVVIGQIHANDDEPVRLYYRKLPGNNLGSVYFAHESRVKDSDGDNIETYVEMIGSRSNSASNPSDGIALDEKFSYQISVNVNLLTVTISREGKSDVVANYDMSESLYDQDGQYHYFKVGVYHLNNSSDPDEYAQATFYEIKNSHTGYSASE